MNSPVSVREMTTLLIRSKREIIQTQILRFCRVPYISFVAAHAQGWRRTKHDRHLSNSVHFKRAPESGSRK